MDQSNDTSTEAAYDYVDVRIDIQNYMEYMGIEIFVNNADPLNVRRCRKANADGKWRWVLFDLDWGFYNDVNAIERWLHRCETGSYDAADNTLFIGMIMNPIVALHIGEWFVRNKDSNECIV